jgi:hypothetical protein
VEFKMKLCPSCRTAYDDFQNFCLKDGTPLVAATAEPQQVEPLEPETVVQPNEPSTAVNKKPATNIPGGRTNYNQPVAVPPPVVVEEKSGTGKIVALTALVTLLFVAVAGGAGYLIWLNNNRQVAQQTKVNQNNANKPRNTNSAVVSNTNTANANANVNANASPSPSPSPSPTVNPQEAAKVRKEVTATINDWKATTEKADLDSHVGLYATTVDYYNGGRVAVDKVRADRQQAFETYPKIEVKIDNVKITPEAAGDKATAIIDKAWRFENDEKIVEGKVQQQLTLEKLGNRWYISGEKDLKVYYKTNY